MQKKKNYKVNFSFRNIATQIFTEQIQLFIFSLFVIYVCTDFSAFAPRILEMKEPSRFDFTEEINLTMKNLQVFEL